VYTGLTLTWGYDNFGNRLSQTASGTYAGLVPQPAPVTFTTGNDNRVDQWSYDAAGEVQSDQVNLYSYDAEGRQIGVLNPMTGLTGYVYDAEGRRVEKVVVEGYNTPNPVTVSQEYLLGLNGEQVTVLGGTPAVWQWSNVYGNGKVLATYDSAGTHFTLGDWLGTKRELVSVTAPELTARKF
jgi:YD repeat-containing protein